MKTVKDIIRITLVLMGATFAAATYSQTILKLTHTDQTTGGRHATSVYFAQKVEEYSKGRVAVKVFCCGQLGNDIKLLEQVATGGVDFLMSGPGTYAGYLPGYNVAMMPFLFDNIEQGWKFYDDSKWMKELEAKAPAKGFRVLASGEAGFRLLTTKTPINGPSDAKGKKMRVAPTEIMLWSVEAMGFGAQIIPITETYLAIQQGAVDGEDNPIDTIYAQKFYEVAPYLTFTNHIYSPLTLAMSEKTWNKLTAPDQEAITRAAKESSTYSRNWVKENDKKMLGDMVAHGAKLNLTPDIPAFRKTAEVVYQKAREKYGAADVDAVLAEAAEIRKAGKK